MGGRGASSGGGSGGTFKSTSDFEKSLTGSNDPRLKEYSDALKDEMSYNQALRSNLGRAIDEDGYNAVSSTITSEIKETQKILNDIPANRTPAQLGIMDALQERLNILKELQGRKGEQGSGRGDVSIT